MIDTRYPSGTPRPRAAAYLAVPAALIGLFAATLFPFSVVAAVATAAVLPVLAARRTHAPTCEEFLS